MNINRIIIGCSRAGSLNNPISTLEIRATWEAALQAGITRFDTANIYAQGDSERNLGLLVRAHPSAPIQIQTKAGYQHDRKAALVRLAKPLLKPLIQARGPSVAVAKARASIDQQDFTPTMLATSFVGSLRRLGMVGVGSLLLHDPDSIALATPGLTNWLDGIVAQGLAREVGVAVRDAGALKAALALAPLRILQIPVTDWEAIQTSDIAKALAKRGIGVQVRQVLARPDGRRIGLGEALAPLLDDTRVTGILIGISQRRHLDALLKEVL